eukprot:TRINITY_DN12017_c0_g1_i1.p1 TRINITY_DN12017_c0_g1~~TRINITY_DN12017_c0_g1_i1.p1  ORF type:complete len:247 (+),score=63.79 TRINITY_DN12017_c0_g1_i1:375-1115(+)
MSHAVGPDEASPAVNIGDSPSRPAGNAIADSPPTKDKKKRVNTLCRPFEELEEWEGPGLKRIKKRLEGVKEEDLPELEPLEVLGTTVQASIVAKFDQCYLLQVQIGRERLHGVMYHAPPPDPSYPLIPPPVMTTRLALEGGQLVMKHPPKKSAEEKAKRDRNAPKLARTCYNFFFSEARVRDLEINPERDEHERSAAIGEQWKKMTAEERKPFQEMALKDKGRYTAELAQYRERLARLESPAHETP